MKQYEMYEMELRGDEPEGSWVTVDLQGEFAIGTEVKKVKGFYAGEGVYKIRFYPEVDGEYSYRITGMMEQQGTILCEKNEDKKNGDKADNTAKVNHGKGIVRAEGLHFQYADGTCYKPFGTTIYGMVHQEKALIDTTMRTLEQAPFNKVRFCLFPKHYDFNHNEPDYYAFEKTDGKWDVHKPCFVFWDSLEKWIQELAQMDIQGDLILFHPYDRWGFSQMSMQDNLVYLDYLLRRLSAFPNLWWSMSNEYDLFPNLSIADWDVLTDYVAGNDPYHHLLSNHNCFDYWDFTKENITHCCIQDVNVNEVVELQDKYQKPIVFDECRYEGNIQHSWGNISGKEMTHRFWTAFVYGGYCTHGETFYDEGEVLWWAKGGILKGESPDRIAFLREIMEEIPGPLSFIREGVGALSVEKIEDMKVNGVPENLKTDFFATHMIHMPKERMQAFLLRHRACFSHYEQDAYVRYYEKECTVIGEIDLPTEYCYRVEVLDTWEMTRTVVEEKVNGKVKVNLPGKEGMAILAVRV